MNISDNQIRMMLHALGIEYTRNGERTIPNKTYRPKLNAYRNYYQINNDADWNDLVDKELAVQGTHIGQNYYFVSHDGIEYLRSLGYRFTKED